MTQATASIRREKTTSPSLTLLSGSTPFEATAKREDAQRLTQALAALPERQRQLVGLRYRAGLSYKEIAAASGLSVTNVGYLLHISIRTLRSALGQDEPTRADLVAVPSGGKQ